MNRTEAITALLAGTHIYNVTQSGGETYFDDPSSVDVTNAGLLAALGEPDDDYEVYWVNPYWYQQGRIGWASAELNAGHTVRSDTVAADRAFVLSGASDPADGLLAKLDSDASTSAATITRAMLTANDWRRSE